MSHDGVNDSTGPASGSGTGNPMLKLHPTTRRQLIGGMASAAAAMAAMRIPAGASAVLPISPATLLAQGTPPPGAAPAEDQVFVLSSDPTVVRVFDFFEQVYQRPVVSDLFSDPLVRMDRNFDIIPAAATSWSGDTANKVWTFELDPSLVWSDGNPVTANDWVRTFQYGADPAHIWDFAWFFSGVIVNFAEAFAGDVAVDQVGVRQGATPNQLIIETVNPAPYLPSMMLYSPTLSAAALDSTGPLYNTDPATVVSSGPFIPTEFSRDQRVVFSRNPTYAGKLTPAVQKVIVTLAAQNTNFTLYQAGEIDYMQGLAPQELQLAQADPVMSKELYQSVGDFRTWYLFFNTTLAPFDNLMVRQAFSHAVDRDAIASAVLGLSGVPAYSFLAPGFPAANGEALKDVQAYNPDMAKLLLADAGFPDGAGFPAQTMLLRNESPLNQTVAGAIAAGITEVLGIPVEVSNIDQAAFTAQIKEIPFGAVSYGMDYLDPSNMLGVWNNGRHPWVNEMFLKQFADANVYTGAPEERIAMFQESERTLVTDVPAVFVYHETPVQLIKPYVTGPFLDPDRNGLTNLHWPGYTGFSTVSSELYLGEGTPSGRG